MTGTRASQTLASFSFLRAAEDRFMSLLSRLFLVIAGSALIGLSAQVEVPWYPVPVTGQTLRFCSLVWPLVQLGLGAIIALLEGGIGLPVFAGGAAGWPVRPALPADI